MYAKILLQDLYRLHASVRIAGANVDRSPILRPVRVRSTWQRQLRKKSLC